MREKNTVFMRVWISANSVMRTEYADMMNDDGTNHCYTEIDSRREYRREMMIEKREYLYGVEDETTGAVGLFSPLNSAHHYFLLCITIRTHYSIEDLGPNHRQPIQIRVLQMVSPLQDTVRGSG